MLGTPKKSFLPFWFWWKSPIFHTSSISHISPISTSHPSPHLTHPPHQRREEKGRGARGRGADRSSPPTLPYSLFRIIVKRQVECRGEIRLYRLSHPCTCLLAVEHGYPACWVSVYSHYSLTLSPPLHCEGGGVAISTLGLLEELKEEARGRGVAGSHLNWGDAPIYFLGLIAEFRSAIWVIQYSLPVTPGRWERSEAVRGNLSSRP